MFRWLTKWPVVVIVAALMGWFGLGLMYLGTPLRPSLDEFWTRYVMIASVLLWSVLSAFLSQKKSITTWLAWGLASPLLGAMLVAPPASFAFVISKGYVAFPVGAATAFLMWLIFQIGPPHQESPPLDALS